MNKKDKPRKPKATFMTKRRQLQLGAKKKARELHETIEQYLPEPTHE